MEEKKTQIVKAWAVSKWTPAQVTEALTDLRVSHTVVGWSPKLHKLRHQRIDGLNPRQPAWPIVTHSVKDIPRIRVKKTRQILFVCDSIPALSHANLCPLPDLPTLERSIKKALQVMDDDWSLTFNEPNIQDFVALASKPSFLNQVQTAIYKINPYSDRKIIQSKVIMFLGGKLSIPSLRETLRSSYKYDPIRELLNKPEAVALKNAIDRVRAGEEGDLVAEEMGIEAFDISYILSSLVKQGTKV